MSEGEGLEVTLKFPAPFAELLHDAARAERATSGEEMDVVDFIRHWIVCGVALAAEENEYIAAKAGLDSMHANDDQGREVLRAMAAGWKLPRACVGEGC